MLDSLFNLHQAKKVYPKDRNARTETARVLVTVKAKPEPSAKYGDTVCVAGIRIDTGILHWVRIYPVPFRYMEELSKFTTWSIIEVPLTPSQEDPRSESYKPDRSAVRVIERIDKRSKRLEYLEPLISDLSMCEINTLAREHSTSEYPSLAAIRQRKIVDLTLEPFLGWTEKQKQNLHKELDLFDYIAGRSSVPELEEPRFTLKIKFLCTKPECRGHNLTYLDWGFEALSRRHLNEPAEQAKQKILERYWNILDSRKDAVIFVGNIYRHWSTYQALGIQRTDP